MKRNRASVNKLVIYAYFNLGKNAHTFRREFSHTLYTISTHLLGILQIIKQTLCCSRSNSSHLMDSTRVHPLVLLGITLRIQ